jgi:FKBP-type peptidyl-prolyl cis-trans isomerase FklB
MKKPIALMVAGLVSTAIASAVYAAPNDAAKAMNTTSASSIATAPQPNMNKVSYTIGYEIGHGFKSQNVDVDSSSLSKGLNDALGGTKSKYTKEQMQTIMQDFQKEMMAKAVGKQKVQGSENLKNATSGMDAAAKMKGIQKLESGIYYQVVKKGDGKTPVATDTVNVNYQGNILTSTGTNGKEFDSSYKRNAPATFPVGQVIPCWTKVLEKMPVGSIWQIYCAPDQAYGKFAPPTIGPNQALTFKVELLSIKASAEKDSVSK